MRLISPFCSRIRLRRTLDSFQASIADLGTHTIARGVARLAFGDRVWDRRGFFPVRQLSATEEVREIADNGTNILMMTT